MQRLSIPRELRSRSSGSTVIEDEQFDRLILEDIPASEVLETSLEINRARFYLHTLSHCLSPGRMLDTRARNGLRMLGFKNDGWQVEGLEEDGSWLPTSPSKNHLEIHQTSVCKFETNRRYDLVIGCNIAKSKATCDEIAEKITALVATDGYLLIEHNCPVVRGNEQQELSTQQLLLETDKLLNPLGFARIDWGRPRKETKAEHLKTALLEAEDRGTLSKILAQPLRLLPNDMEFSIPEFGCLWSLYQKIQKPEPAPVDLG